MLTKPASEVRKISKAYPPPGAETDAKSKAEGIAMFKSGVSPTLDLLSVKGGDQIKNYFFCNNNKNQYGFFRPVGRK